MVLRARRFWLFRQCIHPGMITGWWPEDVAKELQKFYFDLEKRPAAEARHHGAPAVGQVDGGYGLHRLGRRAKPGSENHLRIVQRHARRAHQPRSATHSCARELHQDLPNSLPPSERLGGVGLTILTALANLLPVLPEEEAYLALFHGARRVAADCDGEAPRRERAPLGSRTDPAALKRWLQRWTNVRHREAAERTLLTAIAEGLSPAALADALLGAETERAFADTGHSLDFINKAFECLDLIGWEHAAALLPTVVGQMVAARGAEELTDWRQPVDLVALCKEAATQLPELFAARQNVHGWTDHAALARELLHDDPARIIDALKEAIRAGAAPIDLTQALTYGAALRVARFGNANEHADWDTAHHVFTYTNALHQMLKRIGTASTDGHVTAVRGLLHGAMALYLTRYLNVPPARMPGEPGEQLDDLPADAGMIRAALLDAFDRQRQVDLAARLVARHLTLGHSPQTLIATLARVVLREDAGFHAYQMLEAGVGQFAVWGNTNEGRHILIAVARYLAAHSPTERAALQTADIARRLMRGGELHQEAGAS